jgi:nucleotide-binding universal stress UspA family protein
MTYTSILVHLDPSPGASCRLELARDLAERLGARMVGVCAAEPSDTVLLMGGLPPALLAGHEAQLREICAGQQRRFCEVAGGLQSEWRSEITSPSTLLRRTACLADLVVVGRGSAEADDEFGLAPADAVLAVGRPVLVVPPSVDRLAADRVVVAWKTGRAAALAVQLALPLLVRAAQVTVLGVGEEASQAELADVRDYLDRHGVAADTRRREAAGQATDRAIVEAALEDRADLIVCGAYGRSQILEWALGGVTRGLLSDCPVCCLMAH